MERSDRCIQGDGQVEAAGGRLRQATLTEKDWKQFADGIRALACKREQHQGSFDAFVRRLEKHNFTIFLDAANIAFFNTLRFTEKDNPNARFQWSQVQAVYEAVKLKHPGQEILVVASWGRTYRDCVHSEKEQAFLDSLEVCTNPCVHASM